jgi:hypothetical protein
MESTMVKKFLNYLDAATEFGLKSIRSAELLRMFGAAHYLTEQQISTLRNQLEAKGIL